MARAAGGLPAQDAGGATLIDEWCKFIRKPNRIAFQDRRIKNRDLWAFGRKSVFGQLPFEPYGELWFEIFGDRSVTWVLELLERLLRLKQQPKESERHDPPFAAMANGRWVCLVSLHGIVIAYGRGCKSFRAPKRPRRKWDINRHHMHPKSRGGTGCRSNLVRMRIARHVSWHRLFGIASWQEIIETLQAWQRSAELRFARQAA